MNTRFPLAVFLGALACLSPPHSFAQGDPSGRAAQAGSASDDDRWETRLALGVGVLLGGPDLQVTWRRRESPWEYGLRYVAWKIENNDPYTGRSLGTTTETMAGPTLNYVFRPGASHSPYLGGAVYYWSLRDEYTNTRETPSAATAGLFVGGGWSFAMSENSYANVGLLVAVAGSITVGAAGNSTDADGVDLFLQVGMRF